MAKITKATVKSFIRKNIDDMYINVRGSFDGMTDGIEGKNTGFMRVQPTIINIDNTLGVDGAWFVNNGRDYFQAYEDENGYKGIAVSNCCGYFELAITMDLTLEQAIKKVGLNTVMTAHADGYAIVHYQGRPTKLHRILRTGQATLYRLDA